jgi:hypothetical protein
MHSALPTRHGCTRLSSATASSFAAMTNRNRRPLNSGQNWHLQFRIGENLYLFRGSRGKSVAVAGGVATNCRWWRSRQRLPGCLHCAQAAFLA